MTGDLYLLFHYHAAKQSRLKQAKEEAEKDIADFRAQMEAEFQKKVSEVRMSQKIRKFLNGKTDFRPYLLCTEQWRLGCQYEAS